MLRALLDAWQEDLRYRVSRVKARLKFMVDDYGPEGIRAERRGAARAAAGRLRGADARHARRPHRRPRAEAAGPLLHRRSRPPRPRLRRPDARARRPRGAPRRRRPPDAPAELRRHERPGAEVDATVAALAEIGFPLEVNRLRATAIACTGEPHCNFSVAETKTRLDALVTYLEARFGERDRRAEAPPRRLPARVRPALGRRPRLPGHDGARRARAAAAGLRHLPARRPRPEAAIGRPVFRRVPTEELDVTVDRLIAGWLAARGPGEDFRVSATG